MARNHVENIPVKQQAPLYLRVLAVTCAFFFARPPRGDYASPHFATRGFKNIFLLTLISVSHVLPPFTRAILCAIFLFT